MKQELTNEAIEKLKCFVHDDIYFKKYIALILNNVDKESPKYSGHHLIPVSIYKIEHKLKNRKEALKIADSDPINFRIDLEHSDHILAHYYLCLCAKNNAFKFACEDAFFWMTSNSKKVLPAEAELLKSLPEYEKLYSDWVLNMHHKRVGGTSGTKGKISIYNPELQRKKYILPEELDTYTEQGWRKGGPPQAEETKKIIGENSKKCLTGKNRSEEAKRKTSETLKKHHADPNSGNSKAIQTIKEKYTGTKRDPKIIQKIVESRRNHNNGNYVSEETRKKLSNSLKGKKGACKGMKIVWKNGTKEVIRKEDLELYINNGWSIHRERAAH